MSKLTSLAAVSAAAFVFSGLATAQVTANDYDFNWAPLMDAPGGYVGGPSLFGFGGAIPHGEAAFGDAIRRCYSVDVTQSGKNESGFYETTWFDIAQAYGAANTIPLVDVGIVSIMSATESDLSGDACLSPFWASAGNTGGHKVSAAAIIGQIAGSGGAAAPFFTSVSFQWVGTASGFTGIAGENTIGTDSLGRPLLANIIYEVQGPLNGGPNDKQYYLGTTSELNGDGAAAIAAGGPGARGTGGVTNGNTTWGFNIFGADADTSGAISHTRIISNDGTGTITAGFPWFGTTPGSAEMNEMVAFSTPFLWAENNGTIGGGGPDWNISTAPALVNVWLKDITTGGQVNNNLLWQSAPTGPAAAAFDPTILPGGSFGYFLWSKTPAVTMQQLPMSWDDLGGAAPPKAGSYALNTPTLREGLQTLPVNVDALTINLLGNPGLSLGTPFTFADDPNLDLAGQPLALFEGMFQPVVSGLSKLTQAGGAAFPLAPAPDPTLAGTNLGVGAVTVQLRVDPLVGVRVDIAEVASALTVTLQ